MSDDSGAAAIAGLLGRAPRMEIFRMASSRVGAAGGIALAEGLSSGADTGVGCKKLRRAAVQSQGRGWCCMSG